MPKQAKSINVKLITISEPQKCLYQKHIGGKLDIFSAGRYNHKNEKGSHYATSLSYSLFMLHASAWHNPYARKYFGRTSEPGRSKKNSS